MQVVHDDQDRARPVRRRPAGPRRPPTAGTATRGRSRRRVPAPAVLAGARICLGAGELLGEDSRRGRRPRTSARLAHDGETGDDRRPGPQWRRAVVLRAAPGEHEHAPLRRPARQLLHQAGLAHPGLTDDRGRTGDSVGGRRKQRLECRQLAVPADERPAGPRRAAARRPWAGRRKGRWTALSPEGSAARRLAGRYRPATAAGRRPEELGGLRRARPPRPPASPARGRRRAPPTSRDRTRRRVSRAAPCCPARASATASTAHTDSRKGWAPARASASAATAAASPRPSRSTARSSVATSRSSSSRPRSARTSAVSARSAYGVPRTRPRVPSSRAARAATSPPESPAGGSGRASGARASRRCTSVTAVANLRASTSSGSATQAVSVVGGEDDVRPQQAAQPVDIGLQRGAGRCRRALAPEQLDELVHADGAPGVECERGKQGALLRRPGVRRSAVQPDAGLAQHQHVHARHVHARHVHEGDCTRPCSKRRC